MPVKEQLELAKAGFIANAPVEAQAAIFRHIEEQQQSGILYGLKEGDKAPTFTLDNSLGEQVTLYDELAQGPVVLTFYRGSWCPFCSIQLRAFQQVLPEIQLLGGQLIAISPQSPDNSLSHKEKEKLAFPVLSDPQGTISDSYRLLFELPEYLQAIFKHTLRLDLTQFNQIDRWVLPVPATFLIDKEGIIQQAHVNPDFMKRMDPQELIDQLKML
ncbi:peroxiredoxin-like family protein [Paenibacillus sp. RC67]|uniref:peroxiredoxin-like family protein n=1 Tax=Paenibacillus sp. RC67 TaxID=3039392 RepID=UPI0024AE085B|nr:peroxiredoxin-like family protein [Paenibacillus sp. RC67]